MREFVMLAHQFDEKKHKLANNFISEKLDGMRCLWLPFTRGLKKKDVPFANLDKDERLLDSQISTGLWSRLGNIIHAPDSWLNRMPHINLDGELYGHIPRQDIMSIVKKLPKNRDDKDWEEIYFYTFEAPSIDILFANGTIKSTNFNKTLSGVRDWASSLGARKDDFGIMPFSRLVKELPKHLVSNGDRAYFLYQQLLPNDEKEARKIAFDTLERLTDKGAEGIMARDSYSTYSCSRSHQLVKMKKLDDSEGVVVGYVTGKQTDKGSKLLGKIGAFILQLPNGKTMELSGFTDDEREFSTREEELWAVMNPGKLTPPNFQSAHFPIGTTITFRYRGLSNQGIPNEARYWRKTCN